MVRGGNKNMQFKHKIRALMTVASAAAALSISLVAFSTGGAGAASKPTGTITFAEQVGTTPNYIFPYMICATFSVANIDGFDQQLYRPAYWFGLGSSAAVQPSLSLAKKPVHRTATRRPRSMMKGWKFADGQTVDAESVMFFLNMYRAVPTDYCGYNGKYGIPNMVKNATVG